MKLLFARFRALAGAVALSAAAAAWGAESRIVFVNLDRVFNEFYKTEQADAQLKEQAEEMTKERQAMLETLRRLQDEFNAAREEAQNTALSDSARSAKRDEAEEKLVEIREQEARIRRWDESRRKQLDEQSRRMRKRIVEEITDTITRFAKTEGCTAIVDSSGQSLNGVEVILYADPQADVTEKILELLNQGKEERQTPRPTP